VEKNAKKIQANTAPLVLQAKAMSVPDDVGYRAMTRSQKKIVQMWFALRLKVEIRPIDADPQYDYWRLTTQGVTTDNLQNHFLDWRVRLKP
jgi:hypothetical protein